MLNFFRKHKALPKAMVFVDYEYWYYSYQTLFHIKPNPTDWMDRLKTEYEIIDTMVFGDFSYPKINEELGRLRSITNTIIETGNTYQNRRKKDMTDFIMLDYIYQTVAENKGINTYIIFTGDGHFQSVVKYLVQKLKKTVIVYGIKDSFSKQLQAVASKTVQLPANDDLFKSYCQMIVNNLAYVQDKSSIIPTFLGTVDAVARYNEVPPEEIRMALSKMMEDGYVYQREYHVSFSRKVKIVAANWEKLIEDGYWTP